MFLKRREVIAWLLLLAAAVAAAWGGKILRDIREGADGTVQTTEVEQSFYEDRTREEESWEEPSWEEPSWEEQSWEGQSWEGQSPEDSSAAEDTVRNRSTQAVSVYDGQRGKRGRQILGIILCLTALFLAGTAVFGFRQKAPLLGPDGVSAFSAVYSWLYCVGSGKQTAAYTPVFEACLVFCVLLSVRELWGWIRVKCTARWCLLRRLAEKGKTPRMFLLVSACWLAAALAAVVFLLVGRLYPDDVLFSEGAFAVFILAGGRIYLLPLACLFVAAGFGIACLWMYGTDLGHVRQQLDHFQEGLPIEVRDGAFAASEARLLEIAAQHEEAVRTAVTSERFKVELIANVSHDLRTPLTSILGYSELLQKETLSLEGRQQLSCLYQKAGYMNELVESLFELTKVSSGVVESKKERIDLIRLLEQTIGLFDDQLAKAGLVVRRHYASEAVMLVTDGSRMHQVFANLLGNAIKYALVGTRIYLEVKEKPQSWLVRMTNTSSYEMDFEAEEIMQRFARGDKARSTKGSGLGLAIARTYTESVGGTFMVSTDGDQFSAIVELPKTQEKD